MSLYHGQPGARPVFLFHTCTLATAAYFSTYHVTYIVLFLRSRVRYEMFVIRSGSVRRDREILCAFFDATAFASRLVKPEWYDTPSEPEGSDDEDAICSDDNRSYDGDWREMADIETGWIRQDGWKSDRPLGEWYGVTTDGNGRVIWLGLSSNDVEGTRGVTRNG